MATGEAAATAGTCKRAPRRPYSKKPTSIRAVSSGANWFLSGHPRLPRPLICYDSRVALVGICRYGKNTNPNISGARQHLVVQLLARLARLGSIPSFVRSPQSRASMKSPSSQKLKMRGAKKQSLYMRCAVGNGDDARACFRDDDVDLVASSPSRCSKGEDFAGFQKKLASRARLPPPRIEQSSMRPGTKRRVVIRKTRPWRRVIGPRRGPRLLPVAGECGALQTGAFDHSAANSCRRQRDSSALAHGN
jgi:hypothetical protein